VPRLLVDKVAYPPQIPQRCRGLFQIPIAA
jgi:hypothetical protein